MKKLILVFAFFATALFAQETFLRQNLTTTWIAPTSMPDSAGTYALDVHNYGPDTLEVSIPGTFYQLIPRGTANYLFTLDSLHTSVLWRAKNSTTEVLFRIHK